jgi:RHS repeat-associated protein
MRTFTADGSMTTRLMALVLALIVALTGIGLETGRVLGQDPSPGASVEPDPTQQPEPDPTKDPDKATPRPDGTVAPEPTPEPTPTPEPKPDTLPDLPEVVEFRTAASRTFLRPDGTYVTELFADPAFYLPAGGTDLVAIDPGFGEPAKDGSLTSDHAPTTVIVHRADDPDGLLVLRSGERRLRVHLPDGRLDAVRGLAPTAEEHGRAADLPGALADADLRIVPRATGAALFLVLPEQPADGRFTLLLEATDLEAHLTENGAVELRDADGAVVASMPKPLFSDSSLIPGDDAGRTLDAVTLELDPRGERTALVLTIDPAAIAASTYPAYVDLGLTMPSDPTRSGTTTLAEGFPFITFDERTRPVAPFTSELWLGRAAWNPEATNDVLLAFPDLADLLARADVESATLRFTAGFQADSPRTVFIEQVTENWRAGRVTWRNHPASAPLAGDDPRQAETAQGRVEVTDVTATVRAWDRGEPGTGFLLTERNKGKAFWHRITTGDRRPIDGPRLRVAWTPSPVEATPEPSLEPVPSKAPTVEPSAAPIVASPLPSDSAVPSPDASTAAVAPTVEPSVEPAASPGPSLDPSPSASLPIVAPSAEPSQAPDAEPTIAPSEEPIPGTELIDARTATSRTFLQEDGSYITEYFAEPVFYRTDDAALWREIRVGFAERDDSGARVSAEAPTTVALRPIDDPDGFLALTSGGRTIRLSLPDAAARSVTPSDAEVSADGMRADLREPFGPGTALRVFPTATGVKTFVVLDAPPPSGGFRYVLDAAGLGVRKEPDGSIALLGEDGATVGIIPRPYLYDSSTLATSDLGRYSEDVSLALEPLEDGRFAITVQIGRAVLADATYPILVDPSVTDYVYPESPSNANDAFVWEKNPNTNYGDHVGSDGHHQMWIGLPSGETKTTRTYLRFLSMGEIDLARITSAELRVRPYHQVTDGKPVWIKRVLATWGGSTITWSNQPATGPVLGGDPTSITTVEGVTGAFDVTGTVQAWADGTANHGFMLHENGNGNSHFRKIYSKEEGGSHVPKLVVSYRRPVATATSPTGGASVYSRGLSWTYTDDWTGGDRPQTEYTVQVSGDGFTTYEEETGTGPATAASIPAAFTLVDSTSYQWRVRARDGVGWSDWSTASFTWDSSILSADIVTPGDGGGAAATTDIVGTAAGSTFSAYTLSYQVGCTPGGTLVDIGTNPRTVTVADGILGTWDTSLLSEGPYLVVLSVAASPSPLVDSVCVTVDHTAPTATLEVPLAEDRTVEITGTADDAGLVGYALEIAPGAGATTGWMPLDPATPLVAQAVPTTATLATWDRRPADVTPLHGAYTVRLIVTDLAGNATVLTRDTYVDTSGTGDAGGAHRPGASLGDWSLSVGTLVEEAVIERHLFEIPSYGPAASLTLRYSSLEPSADGRFGVGWTSDLTQHLDLASASLIVWTTADGAHAPFALDGSTWEGLPTRFETFTHQAGPGTWTVTQPDGSALVFSGTTGDLVAIEDIHGQALTIAWGSSSATVTDASGRTSSVTINAANDRITGVTDSAGRSWSFGYSGTGGSSLLESITDPEGAETTIAYDATTKVAETVSAVRTLDGSSQTITWTFSPGSAAGDPVLVLDAPGTDPGVTVTYGDGQAITSSTVTGGSLLASSTHDGRGREVGGSTSYLPTSGGNDAELGERVTRTFTASGLPDVVTVTDSEGDDPRSTNHDYNALGSVTRIVEEAPGGTIETSYVRNGADDITAIERRDGSNTLLPGTITRTYWPDRDLKTETVDDGGLDLTTSYTYTAQHQVQTVTGPDGTVKRYEYDSHGNQTAMVENYVSGGGTTASQNVRTEYAYDSAGNMIEQTDPLGNVTTFEYDDLGRLTRTIRNASGSSGPDLNLTSRTWFDEIGWVAATEDERGFITRSVTDRLGRTTKTIVNCTDSGTTPSSAPASCVGGGTKDTRTNVRTEYTHDDTGNVLSEIRRHPSSSASDVETVHSYDALGRRLSSRVIMGTSPNDTNDLITYFAYDDFGNQIATKDPRGTVTRSWFDKAGNVTATVANCTTSGTTVLSSTTFGTCTGGGTADATWNVETTYAYDTLGRQTSMTAPNGRVTTTIYDDADRVTKVIENDVASPSGNEDLETTYAYDAAGRTIAQRSPTTNRTTFRVTAFEYDALGRQTRRIDSCTSSGTTVPGEYTSCSGAGTANADTNIITTWTYDANGNQLSETAPDPSVTTTTGTATVITRLAYDRAGRLCRVMENATTDLQSLANPCTTAVTNTTSENLSSKYEYDEGGNLVTYIDASGDDQTYTFDALGRMTSRTDGIGGTITWAYDVRGNRLTQANRVGSPSVAVTWTYDKADRMLTRVADSATTSYTWNATGQMLTATNGAGTITAGYDRLGRPTTVTPDDGSTDTDWTYGFTSETRTDITGTTTATLDAFGRETALTTPMTAGSFSFTYRADGQRATQGDPSGATITYTYDRLGRLTDKDVTDANCTGGTCATLDHTYNRAGQRLTELQDTMGTPGTDGTATFTYDPIGRITGYDSPLGTSTDQAYGWQKIPNRDSLTVGTGSPVTTTFDDADRITSSGFSHDADGRMAARPGQQLVWDSLGRLTTVKDSGGTTIAAYTYDALDRLREVTRSGTTLRFRYLGMTTQRLQNRNVTTSTSGRRVAWDRMGTMLADYNGVDSGVRYYGTNGHRDTAWIADGTGAVTATVRYDPWGGIIASSGTTPDWRFQGSWYDTSTDLQWVITRWYAPALGRFISEDTLLGEPTNPLSRHLYAYAEGDPVGGWDPDGRQTRNNSDPIEAALESWEYFFWIKDNFGNEAAKEFYKITIFAFKQAEVWFDETKQQGREGGPQDACRHCIWSGALAATKHIGYVNSIIITQRHEPTGNLSRVDRALTRMDNYNNQYGRTISLFVHMNDERDERKEIARRCYWATKNKSLVTLKKSELR